MGGGRYAGRQPGALRPAAPAEPGRAGTQSRKGPPKRREAPAAVPASWAGQAPRCKGSEGAEGCLKLGHTQAHPAALLRQACKLTHIHTHKLTHLTGSPHGREHVRKCQLPHAHPPPAARPLPRAKARCSTPTCTHSRWPPCAAAASGRLPSPGTAACGPAADPPAAAVAPTPAAPAVGPPAPTNTASGSACAPLAVAPPAPGSAAAAPGVLLCPGGAASTPSAGAPPASSSCVAQEQMQV